MTAEQHRTISLAEFAERATEGEAFEQTLTTGETLAVRIFTPEQADVLGVRKLMMKLVKVADAATREADIPEDDAAAIYEMGFACLRACVRDEGGGEIADAAFVDLFAKLPYKSDLMLRCQDLCGVSLMKIPPLDVQAAVEAIGGEVKAAAEAAKPNRKTRRAAKKKG